MTKAGPEKTVELPRLVFTESLEIQRDKFSGIYALAFHLAQSGGVRLALNATDGLKQQFLAELEPCHESP